MQFAVDHFELCMNFQHSLLICNKSSAILYTMMCDRILQFGTGGNVCKHVVGSNRKFLLCVTNILPEVMIAFIVVLGVRSLLWNWEVWQVKVCLNFLQNPCNRHEVINRTLKPCILIFLINCMIGKISQSTPDKEIHSASVELNATWVCTFDTQMMGHPACMLCQTEQDMVHTRSSWDQPKNSTSA